MVDEMVDCEMVQQLLLFPFLSFFTIFSAHIIFSSHITHHFYKAGPLHGLANQEVLKWIQNLQEKFDKEGKEVFIKNIRENLVEWLIFLRWFCKLIWMKLKKRKLREIRISIIYHLISFSHLFHFYKVNEDTIRQFAWDTLNNKQVGIYEIR